MPYRDRYRAALPATPGSLYQGIVVNGHGHSLTNSNILESGFIQVEVHGLEVRGVGVCHQVIVPKRLVGCCLGHIQEPGRSDRASLEILKNGVLIGNEAEHNLIEVR